uniref:CSON015391 protein n=1 Tax=Culicoides sonorensis TaxID=179676 RepID=A0A336KUQ3_CULSO
MQDTNLPHYCRSCGLKDPTPKTFLTEKWQNEDLLKIFEDCTSINIISDNFSKILCSKCHDKLIEFHQFRVQTRETHLRLINDELFELIEIKEEIEELPLMTENIIVAPLMYNKDNDDEETEDEAVERYQTSTKKQLGVICLGCRTIFTSSIKFRKHMKEKQMDYDHQWTCNYCYKQFHNLKKLESHLMKVHKEFECEKCGEILNGSVKLNLHLTQAHNHRSKVDCCPHCAKFVKYIHNHIAVVHKKLKRYFCELCNRGCVTLDALRAHMRVHTGEKPYKCSFPECDQTFKQSGHRRQHERNFHGPVSDPVTCDICMKLFKNKYTLKEHRKIHFSETIKCKECDAVFALERYLKEHVKSVHNLSDPVICAECGKLFKTKTRLQYHRRQHLGTRYIYLL